MTNPEVSSVRDSDRIIGILASRSRRAERNEPPVDIHLLLTRYDPARVARGEMLTVEDVKEILSIPLLGVIPEIGIGAARVEHRNPGRLRRRRARPAAPISTRSRGFSASSARCASSSPSGRSFLPRLVR